MRLKRPCGASFAILAGLDRPVLVPERGSTMQSDAYSLDARMAERSLRKQLKEANFFFHTAFVDGPIAAPWLVVMYSGDKPVGKLPPKIDGFRVEYRQIGAPKEQAPTRS